ncbi:MAG: hypothetical protein IKS76_04635 [Paludibacteraceae bacterium]|nr:hypothetical protein [Paludibacteraceae bacterium]MBR6508487.1 hypothetical protein [Paludibacteraceae bacterium]
MRNILNIIIICSFITMSAYADMTQYNKSFGQTDYDEMTSDRAVMNSTRYSSPIYEPFSNTTPSEQTEIGSGQSKPNGHIRKGFDVGGDAGQGPSPIGDAVVPMVVLALAFGGVIYLRRRKNGIPE